MSAVFLKTEVEKNIPIEVLFHGFDDFSFLKTRFGNAKIINMYVKSYKKINRYGFFNRVRVEKKVRS